MLESNFKLDRMEYDLETLKNATVSDLEVKMKNPFSTIADAEEIFDNYKNATFEIYNVTYKINFCQDEVSYRNFLYRLDEFKIIMNFEINCNLPKRIEL